MEGGGHPGFLLAVTHDNNKVTIFVTSWLGERPGKHLHLG